MCRIILGHAFDLDLINKVPRLKLDPIDKSRSRLGREVSEAELEKFCYHASKVWGDLARLAYWSGMRLGECRKVRAEYFDFPKGLIRLPGSIIKTGVPRCYPLPIAIKTMLKTRCDLAKNGFLFPRKDSPEFPVGASQRSFQRAIKAAGLDFTFHDLRRSFITRKLKAGMPLEILSKLAGVSPNVARDCYLQVKAEDWQQEPIAVSQDRVVVPFHSGFVN